MKVVKLGQSWKSAFMVVEDKDLGKLLDILTRCKGAGDKYSPDYHLVEEGYIEFTVLNRDVLSKEASEKWVAEEEAKKKAADADPEETAA